MTMNEKLTMIGLISGTHTDHVFILVKRKNLDENGTNTIISLNFINMYKNINMEVSINDINMN